MGCNCGKRKIAVQPKKITKTPQPTTAAQTNGVRRIIKRIAR